MTGKRSPNNMALKHLRQEPYFFLLSPLTRNQARCGMYDPQLDHHTKQPWCEMIWIGTEAPRESVCVCVSPFSQQFPQVAIYLWNGKKCTPNGQRENAMYS